MPVWLHTLDRTREEAVLVHILYSHKKTKLLSILCTGYEYCKDSSVLYSDISDLTVAFLNKKHNDNKNKKKKMEKSGIFTMC